MGGWMNGQVNRWQLNGRNGGWMFGQLDEWSCCWMAGWDGWIDNGSIDGCWMGLSPVASGMTQFIQPGPTLENKIFEPLEMM